MSEVQAGTLIHGTLRSEDLVPAFLGKLEELAPDRAVKIRTEYEDVIAKLGQYETGSSLAEMEAWLLDDLDQALNEIAPAGYYFGAIEGDGSDFGFWQYEED